MDTSSLAFPLIASMLSGVLLLTGIGLYFSFGPGSKKLIDPWDHDDD
tara:strand:+ start:2333 stop:2473 length:141 start_codon:yes stop_codon:yes gene_type:complete